MLVTSSNRMIVLLLGILLASSFLGAGCGGGGGSNPVSISNVTISPSSIPVGGVVTIDAKVTSDTPIQTVTTTVVKPDLSSVDVTMPLKSGSTDVFETTFGQTAGQTSQTGNYSVFVTAKDQEGNTRRSETFKFTVSGTLPKVTITDVNFTPVFILPSDTVTINAKVSATAGIKTVNATVQKPDSTTSVVPMTLKTGTANTFEGTFSETLLPGQYTFVITGTDVNNTSGVSTSTAFTVQGPPPPPAE